MHNKFDFPSHQKNRGTLIRFCLCVSIALLCFGMTGCATTGSSNIQPGRQNQLKALQSIKVERFVCEDETVSASVQNTIIERLLSLDIQIVKDGSADATIEGVITFSKDSYSSGSASAGNLFANAYATGGSGLYVSGITAQIIVERQILASATETQVRADYWIPDPGEVMARKIGDKLSKILK